MTKSRFACPKCGEFELHYKGDPDGWSDPQKYECGSCGDEWDAREVRKLNGVLGKICELCGERTAEIEFNMPVAIEPVQLGKPVGYRMVRGMLCFECFGGEEEDIEIARKLELKQKFQEEAVEKGERNVGE